MRKSEEEEEFGTYSRSVDAQLSGQDEESSSQDVDVDLRRREKINQIIKRSIRFLLGLILLTEFRVFYVILYILIELP